MGNNNSVKRIAAALGGVFFLGGAGGGGCKSRGPFVFYYLYFFCTDLTKKWVSLLNVQFPKK